MYRVSSLKQGTYEKKCVLSENVFDGRIYLSLMKDSAASAKSSNQRNSDAKTSSAAGKRAKGGNRVVSDLNNYFEGLIVDDLNKKIITKDYQQCLFIDFSLN